MAVDRGEEEIVYAYTVVLYVTGREGWTGSINERGRVGERRRFALQASSVSGTIQFKFRRYQGERTALQESTTVLYTVQSTVRTNYHPADNDDTNAQTRYIHKERRADHTQSTNVLGILP
ncbi:hypothetical protein R1flu_007623 [Riccia fluitans]|uniref:Uncharacterized protein n=1 Tax=Riccia fluitans TaxID=41844 RepID=A0ABD1Z236_9MARC